MTSRKSLDATAEIKMLDNIVERLRTCADMLEAHDYKLAPQEIRTTAARLEGAAEQRRRDMR